MKDLAQLRARFLRDEPARRLGNVASDLRRLSAWVRMGRDDQSMQHLVREIAWMMEWLEGAANEEVAEMQRELCRWRRLCPIGPARPILELRARQMSHHLLELSGLVPTGACPGA